MFVGVKAWNATREARQSVKWSRVGKPRGDRGLDQVQSSTLTLEIKKLHRFVSDIEIIRVER
jgi:hypothetical protein